MAHAALRLPDAYRPQFDAFDAAQDVPCALQTLRRAAFERFEALGLPGRRQEAWRFTELAGLGEQSFTLATDVPLDAAALPAHPAGPRVVLVNGRMHAGLSNLADLPDGLSVTSLIEGGADAGMIDALADEPALLDHPFAALGQAFAADAVRVQVAAGADLSGTVLSVLVVNRGDDAMVLPRVRIEVADGARAAVFIAHSGEGRYLSAPLVDLRVADDARLTLVQVQSDALEAWHMASVRAQVGAGANLVLQSLHAGGRIARTDLWVRLAGETANATLDGLVLARDQQVGDHHVRLEHAVPHGTSEQVFRGILRDAGKAVFDGLIHVAPGAQKTDAAQTSRNLLLSPKAKGLAMPRLEIYADDVKCSHGSTAGYLDADALFYLRARGIPESVARGMLVAAFARDSLERVDIPALRDHLETLLEAQWSRFVEDR